MESVAAIEPMDKSANDHFLVLQTMDCPNLSRKKDTWYPALPPLAQCYTGLSPADYFGKTMVEHLPDEVKVGVINVSVGGSDIRLFDKALYKDYLTTYKEEWYTQKIDGYSGNPYQHLLNLAKLAQQEGVIKGILLHQGESNTDDEQWPSYVSKVYDDLLKDLSLRPEDVPLLAGELAHEAQGGKCARMNKIINKLPETITTAHVVSSKGCVLKEDSVHFNSSGIRELGKRYALKMLELQGF